MIALLLAGAAALGGTLLTFALHPRWPLAVRVAAGTALGLTLRGLGGVAGALAFGLDAGALPAAAAASCAPIALVAFARRRAEVTAALAAAWRGLTTRAEWTKARVRDTAAALFGIAALLVVFDRAVLVSPAGLATGVEQNLGDLPFHLAVTAGFAHGDNFPPEHPELAGARLAYPYLCDFLAGLWVKAGASLAGAFELQHVLLAPALLVLLRHFALTLTRDRGAARLAPLLVLLSGGLGFTRLWADWRASGAGLDFLWRLPRSYTIDPGGPLRWGNSILTLLIPQRGWLLGLPLLLIVWSLWCEALRVAPREALDSGDARDDGRPDPRHQQGSFGSGLPRRLDAAQLAAGGRPSTALLARAGLIAGLLPLAHGHCFATAMALGLALAVLFPQPRAWGAFFAAALALGLPQVLLLAHGASLRAGSFVGVHVGWDRGERDPLLFWLLNTGAFLPLLVAAWIWHARGSGRAPRLLRFHAPFALLFVVPNLLRLSPWIWDNVKFLFPWLVGSAPLAAAALARLARGRRPWRVAAAGLAATLTLSGALDVWRVGSRQIALPVFDADGLAFARRVTEVTPTHARLLHWPSHDAPTLLSGRPALLGYPGHIWSQGLDAGERGDDIAAFYGGAAGARGVLDRYGVDFVVLGPQERMHGHGTDRVLTGAPLVVAQGPYRLYAVRSLRAKPH